MAHFFLDRMVSLRASFPDRMCSTIIALSVTECHLCVPPEPPFKVKISRQEKKMVDAAITIVSVGCHPADSFTTHRVAQVAHTNGTQSHWGSGDCGTFCPRNEVHRPAFCARKK